MRRKGGEERKKVKGVKVGAETGPRRPPVHLAKR